MKKAWLIIIIALSVLAVITGYTILDSIFPKASPINYPDTENILTITLINNSGGTLSVEATNFDKILKNFTDAKPTRKMSVNDYPTAKTYYTIKIDTDSREYRYFLYSENSQVYIEIPYKGIYKTNQHFFNYVTMHLNI